jgi:hypothetical protein
LKAQGIFILLEQKEFDTWLSMQVIARKIKLIHHHHTHVPANSCFNNDDHYELCGNIENTYLRHGFSEFAQNSATFPDRALIVYRSINKILLGLRVPIHTGFVLRTLVISIPVKTQWTLKRWIHLLPLQKSCFRGKKSPEPHLI